MWYFLIKIIMTQYFRYAQIVMGPAGSGKSMYCNIIQQHADTLGRTVRVMNLDPAAEYFKYRCDIDIRELVTLDDVMQELELGPNGGLVTAIEYLIENTDWLRDQLDGLGDDDYILIDCPGQIELYTHMTVMKDFVKTLKDIGFSVGGVYCIDCTFLSDPTKYISASLMALAAMNQLEVPHTNILTKCDLISNKESLEEMLDTDPSEIALGIAKSAYSAKFKSFTESIAKVLTEFNLVQFIPLDLSDEDSIRNVVYQIDQSIQYGENLESKINEDAMEQDY
ncbi:unnamed protein product [Blepharisma stoltei]|uniref:GPN-loop GTPase 3 n=1 Tax=Blepharisma stoltei TaxID=1481888 RepID=A0AAU9ITG4_9CILI|nr:unnamed protein product [Blepharisma stoltei]